MKKILFGLNVLLTPFALSAEAQFVDLSQSTDYGIEQDVYDNGTQTFSNNNTGTTLEGNIWKAVEVNYTLTPNTILEFDFSSTHEGEFHGIGFDDNQQHNEQPNKWFILHGSTPWGKTDFNNYQSGTQHYRIPVGEHMTGLQKYLTLINDHDAYNGTNTPGNSTFSNVRLYEDDQPTTCTGNIAELQTASANSAFTVNCSFDLIGSSIALPMGITLNYSNGGSISNGELIFSGGKIDGQLLNASLDIEGIETGVSIISPEFVFDKQRWGLVEGKVSDAVADTNLLRMQQAIDTSKALGATVFELDEVDAYFNSWYSNYNIRPLEESIQIPSDFHLKMSDNTHLRMQPSHLPAGELIRVSNVNNVTITGGHLHGDRFEHRYDPYTDIDNLPRNSHEWPTPLVIAGSTNVLIDGIHSYDGTGDGVGITGARGGHRTDPNHPYNKNVTLQNSTILRARRNGLSITDGEELYVLNNLFQDTGLGEIDRNKPASSRGTPPRFALDVEPYRELASDGITTLDFEKVENVLIEGNTFRNSKSGSFIDYSGINVTVKDNWSDNVLATQYGTGTKYIGNTIEGSLDNRVNGLALGSSVRFFEGQRIQIGKDFVVRDNIIKNTIRGITVSGGGGIVENNQIEGFSAGGIRLFDAHNFDIVNNTITSPTEVYTPGIEGGIGEYGSSNITFRNMTVSVPRKPINLLNLNTRPEESNFIIRFEDSTFTSEAVGLWESSIKNVGGTVEFINNDFIDMRLKIEDANVVQENNRFLPR